MKITPAVIVVSLLAGLPLAAAEEKKAAEATKPAGAGKAKAETPADAAWTDVEALLKGPQERPKTRAEAVEVYKKYLAELDEKAGAFLKAYPKDARRWKVKIHNVQINGMRSFVGMEAASEEEIKKTLTEVITAPDADKDSKAFASCTQVMDAADNTEKFQKLAETHKKAYPDFKGNGQLDSKLKTIEAEKSLKEKPLELSFTSTDGKKIDLAKMRGKVVLVDFWATWCGPCVAEIPSVVKSYKKLHDKGFEIIGISFDQDKDKLAEMTKEKEMTWPQYFDGEGWKNKYGQQFGINSIPRMWLVNKKGMVVDTNGRDDLEKKVEKLLAE